MLDVEVVNVQDVEVEDVEVEDVVPEIKIVFQLKDIQHITDVIGDIEEIEDIELQHTDI